MTVQLVYRVKEVGSHVRLYKWCTELRNLAVIHDSAGDVPSYVSWHTSDVQSNLRWRSSMTVEVLNRVTESCIIQSPKLAAINHGQCKWCTDSLQLAGIHDCGSSRSSMKVHVMWRVTEVCSYWYWLPRNLLQRQSISVIHWVMLDVGEGIKWAKEFYRLGKFNSLTYLPYIYSFYTEITESTETKFWQQRATLKTMLLFFNLYFRVLHYFKIVLRFALLQQTRMFWWMSKPLCKEKLKKEIHMLNAFTQD